MNPTIIPMKSATAARSFYMVTFETHADRTRWLDRNDFVQSPTEIAIARWTSWHNGSDFTHSLEMVPYAPELNHNTLALCLKVYVRPNLQTPTEPKRRGQKGYAKLPEDQESFQ